MFLMLLILPFVSFFFPYYIFSVHLFFSYPPSLHVAFPRIVLAQIIATLLETVFRGDVS